MCDARYVNVNSAFAQTDAFGILGFAFAPYIPLLVGLIAFGFIGTFIGKHALNRLPERVFRIAMRAIVTVIAFRLLFDATSAAMS